MHSKVHQGGIIKPFTTARLEVVNQRMTPWAAAQAKTSLGTWILGTQGQQEARSTVKFLQVHIQPNKEELPTILMGSLENSLLKLQSENWAKYWKKVTFSIPELARNLQLRNKQTHWIRRILGLIFEQIGDNTKQES